METFSAFVCGVVQNDPLSVPLALLAAYVLGVRSGAKWTQRSTYKN